MKNDLVELPPILVADDDEEARRIFVRMFRKMQLLNRIELAADGQEAIDYLSRTQTRAERPPVLALLDLRMPKQSGLDVLVWLRSVPALEQLPVVMLTGSAEMADMKRCYDLDVASYLVKPVGFTALNGVLRDLGLRWGILSSPG